MLTPLRFAHRQNQSGSLDQEKRCKLFETIMSTFQAFRVFDDGGKVQGRVVETTLDELSAGDIVIKAAYSSVNYKDALAATGAGTIIRRFPIVAGIDVSGTVESSADARFRRGRSGPRHRLRSRRGARWRVRRPRPRSRRLGRAGASGSDHVRRDGDWDGRFHGGVVRRASRAQRPPAGERSRHRHRRHRRRRQPGRAVSGGARVSGHRDDREGRRTRISPFDRGRRACCPDPTCSRRRARS